MFVPSYSNHNLKPSMKSLGLQVCDRASTTTHVDREKKKIVPTLQQYGVGVGGGGGVYFNFITFPNIETTWHLIQNSYIY